MSPPIKKILVVVLDNLGDAVMATSILRPLRELYPGARIDFWVKKYTAGLFEDQALLDRVYASDPFWDKAPDQTKGELKSFWETTKKIQEEKYDIAFILNTEWRRSLACLWAKIPRRVGFNRRKSRWFLNEGIDVPKLKMSRIDMHRFLIQAWSPKNLDSDLFQPRLDVSIEEQRWAQGWRGKLGWQGKPILLFHAFSGDERKNWPIKNWADLLRGLSALNKDYRFVFSCTKNELARTQQEFSLIPKDILHVISSFTELKGVLSLATLFVGGDSGPGHIAAAIGKPVLSLFGPTDPEIYKPRGHSSVKVVQKDPLNQLPVSVVLDTAKSFLEELKKMSSTLKV